MPSLTTVEASNQFSDVLNRATYGRERGVLTRPGKPIAALVSIDDLHLLERLIEAAEDQIDLEEATRTLNDPDAEYVPWKEIKRGL